MSPAKIEQTALLFLNALFPNAQFLTALFPKALFQKSELEFGISRIDMSPNGHKGNGG